MLTTTMPAVVSCLLLLSCDSSSSVPLQDIIKPSARPTAATAVPADWSPEGATLLIPGLEGPFRQDGWTPPIKGPTGTRGGASSGGHPNVDVVKNSVHAAMDLIGNFTSLSETVPSLLDVFNVVQRLRNGVGGGATASSEDGSSVVPGPKDASTSASGSVSRAGKESSRLAVPSFKDGFSLLPSSNNGSSAVPSFKDNSSAVPRPRDNVSAVPSSNNASSAVPRPSDNASAASTSNNAQSVVPSSKDDSSALPSSSNGSNAVHSSNNGTNTVPSSNNGSNAVSSSNNGSNAGPSSNNGSNAGPSSNNSSNAVLGPKDASKNSIPDIIIGTVLGAPGAGDPLTIAILTDPVVAPSSADSSKPAPAAAGSLPVRAQELSGEEQIPALLAKQLSSVPVAIPGQSLSFKGTVLAD